jgi:pentose-5-phosphate-3-epimerase
MGMCKEAAVKIIKTDAKWINEIKTQLKEKAGIAFKETKKGLKPPLMLLALDPEGQIIIVTSEEEFNGPAFGPEFFKRIKEVTAVIPTTIITAKGSGCTSMSIGGESLTDIWPCF